MNEYILDVTIANIKSVLWSNCSLIEFNAGVYLGSLMLSGNCRISKGKKSLIIKLKHVLAVSRLRSDLDEWKMISTSCWCF